VTRDLARLRDRVVDLASIDRDTSDALAGAARDFAAGKPEPLWNLLARLCAANTIDEKIETAAARLETDGGQTRIDTLARAASLGLRSLQTRFLAGVGLTPKEFARVLRLQSTLRALDSEAPLAELATDSGFSDQAHATRELKRVTGLTLSRLRDELRRNRNDDATIAIAAAFVRGSSG
jgi:transcriptional regulator GlxA family with amidase domain